MTSKPQQQDYPYIRAWGNMLHSSHYYIDMQVDKAREDNAPQDAIYLSSMDGRWQTYSDITNAETRRILDQIFENRKAKV